MRPLKVPACSSKKRTSRSDDLQNGIRTNGSGQTARRTSIARPCTQKQQRTTQKRMNGVSGSDRRNGIRAGELQPAVTPSADRDPNARNKQLTNRTIHRPHSIERYQMDKRPHAEKSRPRSKCKKKQNGSNGVELVCTAGKRH